MTGEKEIEHNNNTKQLTLINNKVFMDYVRQKHSCILPSHANIANHKGTRLAMNSAKKTPMIPWF